MKDIWVISDTHFNHTNILSFSDSRTGLPVRGHLFQDVDQMNAHMIEKWNSVVKPGDIVYHLGDVIIGNRDWMNENWNRLNGSKRLIVGNHDDIKFLSSGGWFKKVQMWRQFTEFNLLLSHVPLHETSLSRGRPDTVHQTVNVHGHTHGNGSPLGRYISVCVELRDYTPVHIETLAEEAKKLL
jgi:calcineurin-like phosphoesterase family protein